MGFRRSSNKVEIEVTLKPNFLMRKIVQMNMKAVYLCNIASCLCPNILSLCLNFLSAAYAWSCPNIFYLVSGNAVSLNWGVGREKWLSSSWGESRLKKPGIATFACKPHPWHRQISGYQRRSPDTWLQGLPFTQCISLGRRGRAAWRRILFALVFPSEEKGYILNGVFMRSYPGKGFKHYRAMCKI